MADLKNIKYLTAPITCVIASNDDILNIDTSAGATTLYLVNIQSSAAALIRKTIYINDYTGNAATNNITIIPLDGDIINGGASLVLSDNGITAEISVASNTEYLANLSTDNSGGGGGSTFINSNPMPVTLGGYPAGTTFPTPQTMQQMWDGFLYPYQSPSFNSFSCPVFGNYEVGQVIPDGLQTVNYSVANSSNIKVQPPNIGISSTNIVGATFPINPFTLMAAGSFQINIPLGFSLLTPSSRSISLQGTNTHLATFSTSNSFSAFYRNYWGFNANPSLTGADILALASSQLKSGFAGVYTMPSNATTRYIYIVFDNSFGYPTTIFDLTNGFNVTSDFTNLGTVVANNQYGVSQTWRIIRSVNPTAGAGGFQYQLS